MLSLKFNLIVVTLVVGALTRAHGEQSNCNEEGIVTDGSQNQFKVCSEGPEETLTLKTFECGDNSIFSEEEKMCVSNSAATMLLSENTIKAGISVSVKSLKAVASNYDGSDISVVTRSIGNYCPIAVGQYCRDCRTLISCVDRKVVGERSCDYNCDFYDRKCSNQTAVKECSTRNNSIICQTNGLLPDPYFRDRYHLCVSIGSPSYSYTCRYGSYYDVIRQECSYYYDINARINTPYFPRCLKGFQTGVLLENPQLYYVCIRVGGEIKHFIHRCDRNKTFNGTQCI